MVQSSSSDAAMGRKTQTSFFHYVSSEVTRGYELEHDEARYTARRQKMYTFMRIPRELEKFMSYGFFQCLDSFLFVFTFLPLRFVLASLALLWRVPLVWLGVLRPYHGRSLFPAEIIDLLKGLIIAVCVYSMTHIDTSVMYHMIKSQSVIKLYLFYNMLEVGDRLFSAFGQDTIDALFWTATEPRNRKRETIGVIPHFLLTVTYVFLHTLLILLQATTLNVALNASNKALLAIMMSNNFVELKASVFKKFDKNNLFQVSCSDVRERFHLFALLFVVVVQTMKEYGWREESFWSMAPDCLTVLMAEFIVDWLKHAFITRFNEVSAEVYKDYTISLAYDLAQTKQKHALSDHSDLVSRRMGFMPLPLGVVMIRVIWTSIRFNGWGAGIVFVLAYLCLLTFRILGSIVILGKACDLIDQHQTKQKETPHASATTTASASSSSTATLASTHPSSKQQQAQKASTEEHHHPLAANNDKAARKKDSGISVTPFAPVMSQSQVDQLAQNVLHTKGREGNQSDKDTGEASLVSSVLVPKVHDTNIGVNTLKAKKNGSSGEPERARDGKITLASTLLGPPSCLSSLSSISSSLSSSVVAKKDSKLNKAAPFSAAAGAARDHENPQITTTHQAHHDDGMLDERMESAQNRSQGSQSGIFTPTTLTESRFSVGLSGSHLLPDLLSSTSQGTTVPSSAAAEGRREAALLMQTATLTRTSDQEGSTLKPSNSGCGGDANTAVQTLGAAEGLKQDQLKENNHKGELRGHLPQSIENKNNDNGDPKLGLMQTSVDTQSGDGTSSRCCPGSRVEVVSNGDSQGTSSGSHANTITSGKQLSEIGLGHSLVVQAKGHCVDGNGNPNAKLKPISGPNPVSDGTTFMSTEKCSHKVDGSHQGKTTSAMPCGVETCWSYGRTAPDTFRQHSNHRVRTSTVCTTGDIDLPHPAIVSFSSNEEVSEAGSCCSPGGNKGCASSTPNSSPLRLRSLSSPDFMKNDRVFDAERDWPVVIDSEDETEHAGDTEDHMMLQEAHEVHTQTASLLSAVATLVQSASNRGSRHNSSDDCPSLRQRLSSGETSAPIIQLHPTERSSSDGKGNPA